MSFTVKGILQAAQEGCHSLLITLPLFSFGGEDQEFLFEHMRFEVHTGDACGDVLWAVGGRHLADGAGLEICMYPWFSGPGGWMQPGCP